jgi:LPS-assembly lipoprotein
MKLTVLTHERAIQAAVSHTPIGRVPAADVPVAHAPMASAILVYAALACMLASLSACGFRLAGSDPLPGILARPYMSVKDPYTDFAREFEHQLTSSGALIQESRAKSTVTIDITKDLVEQRTLSVSARNIPTEYELTYTVTFAVRGPDKELLAPQTIHLSQDYSFEENKLLAKEHEADILRRQMARDLVAIAMRRLTSLK